MSVVVNTSVSGGGSGSGGGSFATITGMPTDNANLATALAGKGDVFAAVVLGAGPTNITHATHANRDVSSAQAAATSIVFAATATSGALAGDIVTVLNTGAGRMTASGTITAAGGYKLSADTGEEFIAIYNAATDSWFSNTPNVNTTISGYLSYSMTPTYGATALMAMSNVPGTAQLDTSAASAVNFTAATKYGSFPKVGQTGAAAAVSRLAGVRGPTPGASSPFYVPTAGVQYGWRVRFVGAVADAIAAGQFGMGLMSVIPAWTASGGTNVQPSAMVNVMMLAADEADGQVSIMHNDGAGACTKIALNGGAGFPNNTNAADLYAVEFAWDGPSDILTYRVENMITNIIVTGTIAANKPVAGTSLSWFVCRGSANTATTPVMHFGGMGCGDAIK